MLYNQKISRLFDKYQFAGSAVWVVGSCTSDLAYVTILAKSQRTFASLRCFAGRSWSSGNVLLAMDPTSQDVIDQNLDCRSCIAVWASMQEGQWKQLAVLLGFSDSEFRAAHPRLICALPEAAYADVLTI